MATVCQEVVYVVTEYNITVGHRPFSDQVMLLTDQCSRWSAICADQIFQNCNSLLLLILVFITCYYYSYYYYRIVTFPYRSYLIAA